MLAYTWRKLSLAIIKICPLVGNINKSSTDHSFPGKYSLSSLTLLFPPFFIDHKRTTRGLENSSIADRGGIAKKDIVIYLKIKDNVGPIRTYALLREISIIH